MAKICGPKLSNCCFVLSIWGIILLVFLGIFFQIKSVALREDISEFGDYKKTSRNCFIAAGLYLVTLAIAGHQKWSNQRMAASTNLLIDSH
ncbi:ribonuclease kappa-B-like isoform X2 [Dendronephthya gigantea]|uniref:ribonuclease kappa-B-like isoform X2 n=1 Tax=Dendronephthya gigantea TaxID=151771 RepID=UPI00106B4FE6|nr:ribonuclease kappa-B-like isoform X2 [Dendronephthya gigantea]